MKSTLKILICLFLLSSCDYADNKLIIHNASMDTVFYTVFGEVQIIESTKPYYYRTSNHEDWKDDCLVPGESENSSSINISWENLINTETSDKKLKVIFFKKQFLDTTNWEKVVQGQLYSKKLEYTVEDLINSNWVVTYRDSLSVFISPPDSGRSIQR